VAWKPEPVFLQEGDVMELSIEGLGRQRQLVRRATTRSDPRRRAPALAEP
jgi:hypothetical protein